MDDQKPTENEVVLSGDGTGESLTPDADEQLNDKLNDMSRESKVYLKGHSTEEQYVPSKLNVKKTGIGKRVLVVLAAILFVAAVAVAGWALYGKNELTRELAATRSELNAAEATADQYKTAAQPPTDDEQIKLQALAYAMSPVTSLQEKITITIQKVEGEYARVSVQNNSPSIVTPTYDILLKKSAGAWTIIGLSTGGTSPAQGEATGFPTNF